jgi:Ca2+-binding RTX toxin-like protein
VPILGDDTLEPDETFFLNLSNLSEGELVRATATGTIENDEVNQITGTAGDDTIALEGNSEGVVGAPPSDGPDRINALGGNDQMFGGGGADVFIFSTGDGNDIIGTGTNVEEFEPGADKIDLTNVAAITDFNDLRTFHVYDDQADSGFFIDTDEAEEGVFKGENTIQLSGWDINEFYSDFSADDFIFANGNSIYISDVQLEEGSSGGTTDAVFTVSLSTPVAAPVTVDYATADGTAEAGTDYTAVNGTLTFAPDATEQEVRVPILGDDLVEPDESFFVNLSNPVNDVIADGQGQATITDDDEVSAEQIGPSGNNTMDGGAGDDVLAGGRGNDSLTGGAGDDDLAGGRGDDSLTGGAGDDDLTGGRGNDSLTGGAGDDDLTGGRDNDSLTGGRGNDDLTGGSGSDTFVFAATDGDPGHDIISDFHVGEDLLRFDGFGSPLDEFADLDTNANGQLDEGDANVSVVEESTVIDLSGQTEGAVEGSLTVVGVTGLQETDILIGA